MKNNQKCVWMSDEVLEYVMRFPGEGFNAQFENAVLYFKTSEPDLKRRLAQLQKEIRAKQDELRRLAEKADRVEGMKRFLDILQGDIQDMHARAQKILDESCVSQY